MNSCYYIYPQSIHIFSEPEIAKFEYFSFSVFENKDILRLEIPMGYFESIMKKINSICNLTDYENRERKFNSFLQLLHVLAKIKLAQLHFNICKIISYLDQIVDIHNKISLIFIFNIFEFFRQFNLLIIIIVRLIALNISMHFLNRNIFVYLFVSPFVDDCKSSFTKNVPCIVFQR